MIVAFDLTRLSSRVINLLINASGGDGWLAEALQQELEHRAGRGEPPDMCLPVLTEGEIQSEYHEFFRACFYIEAQAADSDDPTYAVELSEAAALFYEISRALVQQFKVLRMVPN